MACPDKPAHGGKAWAFFGLNGIISAQHNNSGDTPVVSQGVPNEGFVVWWHSMSIGVAAWHCADLSAAITIPSFLLLWQLCDVANNISCCLSERQIKNYVLYIQ